MKTPREILFARHAGAADDLDAMRKKIVADIAYTPEKSDSRQPATFLEFILSLRWHTAAMGAAWVLILLLGRANGDSAHGAVAAGGAPPPLIYFTALREYRRELAELAEPPPRRAPPSVPHAFTSPRRREAEIDSIA